MRQRKIKNVDEKIEALGHLVVRKPEEARGRWREEFGYAGNGQTPAPAPTPAPETAVETAVTPEAAIASAREARPLYLEVGCGKGRFITEMALKEPNALFIGAEGLASVVYRALTKVDEAGLSNVRFITSYVRELDEWFAEEELDGIFLNFSDPWPKVRNSKRRLTHGGRLLQYSRAIKKEGFIRFKTDNEELFDFTLKEVEENRVRGGFRIGAMTRDLHSSSIAEGSPMTEYEEKFSGQGKKINYIEIIKE